MRLAVRLVAIILPAKKLPFVSLATIVDGVFRLVAVVLALLRIPVVSCAKSTYLLDKFPFDPTLRKPKVSKLLNDIAFLILTLPVESIFILSTPFVIKDNVFADVDVNPVVLPLLKVSDGAVNELEGKVKAPVIMPPVNSKFPLAFPVTLPVRFAVIFPAEKSPNESLATIALAVFRLVAVVAEFATNPI